MMTRAVLATLCALGGTAAADVLVASQVPSGLAIQEIAGDKVTTTFQEANTNPYAFVFGAAGTLWVLRKSPAGVTVGSVAGGKAGPTTPITLATFHLKADVDMPSGYDQSPGILTTRKGEVWLTRCLKLDDAAPGPYMHCITGYVRVDDGSLRFAATRPRDTSFETGTLMRENDRPPPWKPLAAPPAGYAVTLTKQTIGDFPFTGWSCTGGGHKLAWPVGEDLGEGKSDVRFEPHATKATWISATPPIVHIELNGVTPIGEKMHDDAYVLDCAKTIAAPIRLGGGLLLTGREIHRADGTVVGTIAGTNPVIAP